MRSSKQFTAKKLRTVVAGIAALASVAALGACSVAGQSKSGQGNESGAGASTTVTVAIHDSFNLPKELIEKFEKVSGYKLVTTAPGDAGMLLNQLLLSNGKGKADAYYGIDNFSYQKLGAAGALAPTAADQGWDGGKSATLADPLVTFGSATAVPIDRGDVCLNVDSSWFKAKGQNPPATFDDIIKPEYKDLTVVENPAKSSPGFAMLVGTQALYADGWKDYWNKLLANGVKVADGWSDAYSVDYSAGEGKGKYPIMLSYGSSPADAAGATSSLDATCVRQIEYAGVLAGATNPEGAQAFVNFMLSQDVQSAIADNMYMYPEREGVSLPEKFAKYAKLADSPIKVDVDSAEKNRDTWIKEWTALFEAAQK
ncbi:MAG: thiamine ABC transporter substrate-binding protein [Actinomycetaceae bacterium]|nr:thiamine ABC transporter substrate-binding protein [Arcanobacterium sp.]MDD7687453.1 thiamine ABC transporter substrate-binding protein [Actinomycetaceae bacterium]MDY5272928.1 thiamine ABC transporter substrate-binding protein [Arcanobacterium sp.]